MKALYRVSFFVLIFSVAAFIAELSADVSESFNDSDSKITISLDFKDASLKDILKLFSMQSGLNFISSENVQDRKVTLFMDKVPLEKAMDKLFRANNLTYELDKNSRIFIVKDLGKPEAETITKVFYLKFASVSSSSLLGELGNSVSSGTTGGKSGSKSSSSSSSSSSQEGRWKVADSAGITSVVTKLLSKDGIVIEDYRTNSLIVMDTPKRIDVIGKTIAAIDVPVPQVMLEVEMLDVSKGLVDRMGIKYNGGNPFTMSLSDMVRYTKFPWAALIPKGESVNKADGTNFPGMYVPTTLTLDSVSILVDFLKTQTDTKSLARPRILTLNNETAEIKITTNETIGINSTVSTGAASVTAFTAERTETGVHLRVTPQINLETGEVTMFIVPTVKDTNTSTFPTGDSGILASTFFKDPEERSTKSVIRVKDGETIIMGGLIRHDKSETITKVPFFSDIPLMGRFFKHRSREKDRERELLVFITPKIIKDGSIMLAQAKKSIIPEREQSIVSGYDRSSSIGSSLDNFERSTSR